MGCTVGQLSRLLWRRPRRTDTWTSQPMLVSLVGWLVCTVDGEQLFTGTFRLARPRCIL
jgi:hypothetical protein